MMFAEGSVTYRILQDFNIPQTRSHITESTYSLLKTSSIFQVKAVKLENKRQNVTMPLRGVFFTCVTMLRNQFHTTVYEQVVFLK